MKNPQYLITVYGELILLACLVAAGRSSDSLRLPNNTIPTHYSLRLHTNIHRGVFEYSGVVRIELNVLEPSDRIVLHSLRSVVVALQLHNGTGHNVPVKMLAFDEMREFLVVHLIDVLPPSNASYTMEITFNNSIDRTDLAGFYKSSYVNERGVTRYLGVTDFQPTDARTAFPCYDEPGIKTTFDIAVSCGEGYHVLSNAPLRKTEMLESGLRLYTFQTTPRMQTYLVAWLVSDYVSERVESPNPRPISIASWSWPSVAHQLSHSVEATRRSIRTMEKYFGEPYSMSKIDNVAIRAGDFAAGAMENWGMITYGERSILYHPNNHTQWDMVRVTMIVAHELTHQFLGNLLAPKWWTYLWLNEGFAGFFQYYMSYPELAIRPLFIVDALKDAFIIDGHASVRPMTYYTESRKSLVDLFDGVVYDKAASVLRMMHYSLGAPTFRKGLQYYIRRNKDRGVVEESDLFESLQQAAKEDGALPAHLSMHDIFRSWSQQAGVPMVTVRRVGMDYYLTQQRYYDDPRANRTQTSWWIPITFSTARNKLFEKHPAFWMAPDASRATITIPTSDNETVLFNPHATGYYRIRYDRPLLDDLVEKLNHDHGSIESAARARLIDDTMQIAFTEGGEYDVVFRLLNYLQRDTDYMPWVMAHENLRIIQAALRSDEKESRLFQSFTQRLAAPLLERVGVETRPQESPMSDLLRSIAIEWACSTSEYCKQRAKATVDDLTKGVPNKYDETYVALLSSALKQLVAEDRRTMFDQMSQRLLMKKMDTSINRNLQEFGLVTWNSNNTGSYARHLFGLGKKDRSEALYRLIVELQVTPGELVKSIQTELSLRQRKSVEGSTIPKTLFQIARYITEPSEMKLLSSVALEYAPSIASEIEQQVLVNVRWLERNTKPLAEALHRFMNI